MAGFVSGCVSVLAGLCVFGLLPDGERLVAPRPLRTELRDGVLAVAAALGRALGRAGLAEGELSRRAVQGVRALPFRRGFFAHLGGDECALGVLALLSLVGGVTGLVVSASPAGALAGLLAPMAVALSCGASCERMQARELEEAMPEAFGALAIALGSGHSLSQAMRFVGVHASEPVRSEFMRVSFSIDCGISAAEALDAMLARLPAPGLDLVALALKVSQRTGAPLRRLLGEAARLVGTRIELKRHLDVKTSQARMSARLVAGMPVAMMGVLTMLSEDFREGVAEPAGAVSIALAIVLNVAAWSIISRIMKVRL